MMLYNGIRFAGKLLLKAICVAQIINFTSHRRTVELVSIFFKKPFHFNLHFIACYFLCSTNDGLEWNGIERTGKVLMVLCKLKHFSKKNPGNILTMDSYFLTLFLLYSSHFQSYE